MASREELRKQLENYLLALEFPAIDEEALARIISDMDSKRAEQPHGTTDVLQSTMAMSTFDDRRHAHIAVDELCRAGFSLDQIGFVMPDGQPVIDHEFHSGQTIVTVQAGERHDEAVAILRRAAEAPEQDEHSHPGRRRVSGDEDIQPGSTSVFVGE